MATQCTRLPPAMRVGSTQPYPCMQGDYFRVQTHDGVTLPLRQGHPHRGGSWDCIYLNTHSKKGCPRSVFLGGGACPYAPLNLEIESVANQLLSTETKVISETTQIPSGSFPVGGEIDIAVDLASPSEPGWYTSYWRLVSADGLLFGEPVWAQIQVENPQPSSAVTTGFHGDINLNLPFESSGLSELGIVDMNAETAGAACAQPNLTTSEPESFLDATPSASVEPVKQDSFLGASYGNAQLPPDLITLVTPETSSKASTATDIPECVAAVGENPVEQWLLKELEEMGFEHLDLNKDILRQNEYNLERCVDELCGSTGWDVLLEELKELGFADEEINKKMLVKNGGSIKRVVLDLIAEEKHG